MTRPTVYIAGPLTLGDQKENVTKAIQAADLAYKAGYDPFIPHLFVAWDALSEKDYEEWLTICFRWVDRCDVVWRIPGESVGSDREVYHATHQFKPVVFSLEDLVALKNKDVKSDSQKLEV